MFGFRFSFDAPHYLWLLTLLVPLWWFSFRRLAQLGTTRRLFALLLRSLVIISLVLALAGLQWVWVTDRITVVYLLDQSDSIPQALRRRMLDFAIDNARRHRDAAREDRVGLIAFGREAAVEVPPFDAELPAADQVENLPFRTDATSLEAALKLAQAIMPADSQRRIVLVTDGKETLGDAAGAITRLAESGIGVDVVPVRVDRTVDTLVEKVDLPNDIRKGTPFEARVVINHDVLPGQQSTVSGRLSVTRSQGREEELLLEQPVTLGPGKNVFPVRHQIDLPAPYTYEAKFIPDDPAADAIDENNTATAFTYVRGKGRVLLIEPWDAPDSYRPFADQLRKAEIEVTIQSSNALFTSLAELQTYDAVILAGVPRTVGDTADSVTTFTDNQIDMLVRNTQQLGCGLLMIGSPEALGAGGWTGTALEAAMPVDFRIKNKQVSVVGALQIVLDASGSMQGEKLTLCKAAAVEAVKALQPFDHIGVIAFDGGVREVVPIQPVGTRTPIIAMISRIAIGGGTDLYPAMEKGFLQLRQPQVSTRHMIILTDGQTPPNDFGGLTRRMKAEGVTVSSVAIGSDADVGLLRDIASVGGGKLYQAVSPQSIPRIVMREARRISRGLIHESPTGFLPQVTMPHPVLNGIDKNLPPLTGFVMTTPKSSPLVQTLLESPVPSGQPNPILSLWQYGLGRTAVLTTDTGRRWAADWARWPGQEKILSQLVRWLMKPTGDNGEFTIATQARGGEVQVIVSALDPQGEFLNALPMTASALGPELKPVPLTMRQTAPGRYVGTFPADSTGNYFINVSPRPGAAPLAAGVTIPYSDEYRLREFNGPFLQSIAAMRPRGGQPGQWIDPETAQSAQAVETFNPFREGLISERAIRDVWPWAVLVGCYVFLADVFVRRVATRFDWLRRLRPRFAQADPRDIARLQRLDALRAKKADVAQSLDTARTTTPAAPTADTFLRQVADEALPKRIDEPLDAAPTKPVQPAGDRGKGAGAEAEKEPMSYTERLLEAKRQAKRGGG